MIICETRNYNYLNTLTERAEETHFKRFCTSVSIYSLQRGQYRYSGHGINLPQDVMSFATSLPRLLV